MVPKYRTDLVLIARRPCPTGRFRWCAGRVGSMHRQDYRHWYEAEMIYDGNVHEFVFWYFGGEVWAKSELERGLASVPGGVIWTQTHFNLRKLLSRGIPNSRRGDPSSRRRRRTQADRAGSVTLGAQGKADHPGAGSSRAGGGRADRGPSPTRRTGPARNLLEI